jgi:PH domain
MKVDDDNYSALLEELASRSHETTTSAVDGVVDYAKDELKAFLSLADSVSEAASNVLYATNYKAQNRVSIADIAPFLRAPPGGQFKYPESCYVCLEDMKGDCARDKDGRPIVLHLGMPYGTADELKQMCCYAMERARQYVRLDTKSTDLKGKPCCIIMEVMPREKGQTMTFRIPDAPTRSMIDHAKVLYPDSQYGTMHFCGVPIVATLIYSMCKLFMPIESYQRLNLYSSCSPLQNVVDNANRLPQWDNKGTFQFDFDEYVEWRAREEGVAVIGRGEGRQSSGQHGDGSAAANGTGGISITDVISAADAAAAAVTSSSEGSSDSGSWTSASSASRVLTVLRHGRAQKRGSGKGLFKSHQWKEKYLAVLGDGFLLYFDSTNTSNAKNYASRVIRLDTKCQVTVELDDSSTGSGSSSSLFLLSLQAEQRQFLFGFSTLQEANQWMQAIQQSSSSGNGASE